MPRNGRKPSKTGMYHIVHRGINRQSLFHDDDDYDKMLEALKNCTSAGNARTHAYCLMANHIHILLQTGGRAGAETPPQTMKRIATRYAKYYNFKYSRSGPLFEGRYKSEPIETDECFLAVLRYIHRDPVIAGIAESPAEYRWSSYGEYAGKDGFVYTDLGIKLLGNRFDAYMQDYDGIKCLDIDDAVRRLTDQELSAAIEEMLRIPAADIGYLDPERRNAALRKIVAIDGVTYRQIAAMTGISPSMISRAVNK